jgi:hypothetical protein
MTTEYQPTTDPLKMLVEQIANMRDRAKRWAEESEELGDFSSGEIHRTVESAMNRLLRLHQFYQENPCRPPSPNP